MAHRAGMPMAGYSLNFLPRTVAYFINIDEGYGAKNDKITEAETKMIKEP